MYSTLRNFFIATISKPTFITPAPFAGSKSLSAVGALKYKLLTSVSVLMISGEIVAFKHQILSMLNL